FSGKNIDSAFFSSPIKLVGFDKLPTVGSRFETFESKKDAEKAVAEYKTIKHGFRESGDMIIAAEGTMIVPIILKKDVARTGEAIANEIEKINDDNVIFKIIKNETGSINESDVKLAFSDSHTIIIGFHVSEDTNIKNLNGYESLTIKTFDIIYKLTE